MQFFPRFEYVFCDLGLGADTENMYVPDLPDQFLFCQGLIDLIYMAIIMRAKLLGSGIADIFHEKYTYFFFRIAGFFYIAHAANIYNC